MQKLLKDIQQGNELAFKQLTEKYAKDLYKIARARLKNEEDIKDATQNTMIIVYGKIHFLFLNL